MPESFNKLSFISSIYKVQGYIFLVVIQSAIRCINVVNICKYKKNLHKLAHENKSDGEYIEDIKYVIPVGPSPSVSLEYTRI